jgi:hypothetical protein
MIKPVPIDSLRLDWSRLAANAINALISKGPAAGDVRYQDGVLEWYDGTSWQAIP